MPRAPGTSSRSGWAFVAFPVAIIVIFSALPAAAGVGLSLFEWSGGTSPRFVGLRNYADLVADPGFGHALRNTLLFALAVVPVTTILAFLVAVALDAPWFRGRTLLRTVFFLPTVISVVAVGFVWRWVLDPTPAGLLNRLVAWWTMRVGDGTAADPIDWLGDSPLGLAVVVAISIWRGLGFSIVLYLAALGGVPRSLHDAAAVDGAGGWQTIRHVTWPGVRAMTGFLLVTGMINALQVFDVVLVMIGRNERIWTDVLNLYLYREFIRDRLGFAAAVGVVILLLTLAVTSLQLRRLRGDGTGGAR